MTVMSCFRGVFCAVLVEVSAEEDLDPKEGQLQNLEERLTTDGYLEEVKEKFEAHIFFLKTRVVFISLPLLGTFI